MGYPVKDSWHHWTYTSTSGVENQVAGYATNYEVQGEVSHLFVWCVVYLCLLCCLCLCWTGVACVIFKGFFFGGVIFSFLSQCILVCFSFTLL